VVECIIFDDPSIVLKLENNEKSFSSKEINSSEYSSIKSDPYPNRFLLKYKTRIARAEKKIFKKILLDLNIFEYFFF
jgi:hypothetical protein